MTASVAATCHVTCRGAAGTRVTRARTRAGQMEGASVRTGAETLTVVFSGDQSTNAESSPIKEQLHKNL